MKTKYIITGPGGTGKTTLAASLAVKLKLKIGKLITTRSRRDDTDTEYYFITDERFNQRLIEDKDSEHSINISHEYNGWKYGLTSTIIQSSDIFVLGKHMAEETIKYFNQHNIPNIVIFCYSEPNLRYQRMMERGDNATEVLRRTSADERDFELFTDYDIIHCIDIV